MGDINDFFSPEALRLLEESKVDCAELFQPPKNPTDLSPSTALTNFQAQSRQEEPHFPQPVHRCSTVFLGQLAKPKRKRAKFDIKAREKVATVREKGACLRCRLLKITCSSSRPCTSCTHNSISCHTRESKHQWMDCVRYWPKDFDIYSLDYPCSGDEYEKILQFNWLTPFRKAKYSVYPEVHWDLGSISSDCVDWILDERLNPESNSRVYIFSSLKAENLLSKFVGGSLSQALRVLVETSSVLHHWGMDARYSHFSSSDLWKIRSFAGNQVLHGLEHALRNASLAKASAEVLKALFLVLLGTIIAVGYSSSVSSSDECRAPPLVTANAFEEARKELLRSLAHHMILIAERVHLMNDPRANCYILENAYRAWHGKAVFKWETVRLDEPKAFQEDFGSIAGYGPVYSEQALGFAGSSVEESPLPFYNVATSIESPSGMYFDTACCRPSRPLFNNGLISENSDHFGDPPSGQLVPENQTSTNNLSTPYTEDQWNLWDPQNVAVESTGELFAPSREPGLHNFANTESNSPWPPGISDASNLGILAAESDTIPAEYDLQDFTSLMSPFNEGSYGGNMDSSGLDAREVEITRPTRSPKSPTSRKRRASSSLERAVRAKRRRKTIKEIRVRGTWVKCNSFHSPGINLEDNGTLMCARCQKARTGQRDTAMRSTTNFPTDLCTESNNADHLRLLDSCRCWVEGGNVEEELHRHLLV